MIHKKIACLVFGIYGDFDTAVKFWDFKDQLDCDFYFSTWDLTYKSNYHSSLKYGTNFDRFVTSNMILDFIPDAVISIQNEIEYNIKNNEKK